MFWDDESAERGERIWTDMDQDVYTHILYLDVSPELVAIRRRNDRERSCPVISVEHLCKWQNAERRQLRELCRETGILFSVVYEHSRLWNTDKHITQANFTTQTDVAAHTKLAVLLRDFQYHTELHNTSKVEEALDVIIDGHSKKLDTMLVLDADRTLAPVDTGSLFWMSFGLMNHDYQYDSLEMLFKTQGYSYNSFR
jgi:hypothetical protein